MAKTHQQNNSPEVVSLVDILSRPIANQVNDAQFNISDAEIIVEEAGFDQVAIDQEAEQQQQQQTAAETDQSTPLSLSPDDLAIILVNMFDGAQKLGFTVLKRNMTFTRDELELLQELDPSNNTTYSPNSKEAIAKAKYKKYLETIKKIPLDKGEKERLTTATTIYARTVDLKVSPLTGLVMAFTEVLGTRAYTVFGE